MAKPLEILGKILRLEEQDYQYHDKAVAGGLACYADTWTKQATQLYGESSAAWVEDIARRLREYSELTPEARREALQALHQALAQAPGSGDSTTPPPPPAPRTQAPPAPKPAPPTRRPGQGLDAPVLLTPGVGKKRAELLTKLGVKTIRDLLFFYPRRYEDYSTLKTIDHLEYGEQVSILGTVLEAGGRETRSGKYIFHVLLNDDTGTIELTWFNQRYLEGRIRPGMQLLVSGKIGEYLGRLTMNAPQWEVVGRKEITNARIQPVYPLTEGLTQRWLRLTMERTLSSWAKRVPDPLPESIRQTHKLIPLWRALWGIHLPDNQEHLAQARQRLAFDEALYLQLGLLRQKLLWKSQPGPEIAAPKDTLAQLKAALPYTLTQAQQRSLDEMLQDMASGSPMNRLLQGDVGSGKTVVAALLMAVTVNSGYQAALMAPTEILAEQHYASLSRLFEAFPNTPRVALLTGSTPAVEREELYASLADGSLKLIVGTHALIQESVQFANLALVVIDEQHRFGVEQRGRLRQKGYNPHLLAMTATPIPRSLELTIWGHVDVSVLDEMPPGRQPIETRVLYPRERERAYTFIRHHVKKGRQAFIIYPLVESSEKIDARAAVDEYERLQRDIFPDLRLGLLHGRMKSAEKDAVMQQFIHRELDILVATSVVEVGIDVPNASVMLIEGAERFGLAQLHQFRGRVGRGKHKSYCLLLSDHASENALERLRAVEATNDGFELAQKDLELRGPGEFLGTRQSGFPELQMAMLADTRLLHEAREVAESLLQTDPELEQPEHHELRAQVADFWKAKGELS